MTSDPAAITDPHAHHAPVPPHRSQGWDAAYAGTPAWDIGRPQSAFIAAAENGLLRGRSLDIGCGTGETTLLAAAHGADALGIDVSQRAIDLARAKAVDRGLSARFAVADIVNLDWTGPQFDVTVDSGTFHLFDGNERAAYVGNLRRANRAGGTLYLLCARASASRNWGPPGLSKDDLADAFSDGWAINDIQPSQYEVTDLAPVDSIDAWFASIMRL
ncbi:MAG: class I SAM-dependent methyltransferase [Nakamurella sp.]